MQASQDEPKPRFWLFKTEPDVFSIDDLEQAPDQTTFWDGVRNYQARNSLRDDTRVGDGVFLYHSNTDPLAIVGTARIVRAGYLDHTAWDPKATYYDPKASADKPTWYMVDIQFEQKFAKPIPRTDLMNVKGLEKMVLLQRGSRLSVQPVTRSEWDIVLKLAGVTQQ